MSFLRKIILFLLNMVYIMEPKAIGLWNPMKENIQDIVEEIGGISQSHPNWILRKTPGRWSCHILPAVLAGDIDTSCDTTLHVTWIQSVIQHSIFNKLKAVEISGNIYTAV
jgi:hypothetical protein